MAGLLTDLQAYMRDVSARPFEWGYSDCLLWMADWLRVRHGVDPVPGWRGAYSSEAGARAIVDYFGGVVPLCEEVLADSGLVWRQIEAPALGDVGVIDTTQGPVGAIRGQSHWLARSEKRGVAMMRAPVLLRAWSVCPR